MTRNIAANAAAAGKRMRKPRHAHSNRQDASTMLSTISAVRPSAFQKASKPGRAASTSRNTALGWQKSGRSAELFGELVFNWFERGRRVEHQAYAQNSTSSSVSRIQRLAEISKLGRDGKPYGRLPRIAHS